MPLTGGCWDSAILMNCPQSVPHRALIIPLIVQGDV